MIKIFLGIAQKLQVAIEIILGNDQIFFSCMVEIDLLLINN
jgi:hypothetical protein